ncbi:MAG TPA: hypothetical protein VFO15_18075 [Xanthobacteraceae bacterium]|nr:hypothetical protein [Xanthobacteraceae bacterium]
MEEATATGEMWSAQDNTEAVFQFNGVRFADSDLEGALPFFAICDVVNAGTGETGKLSCGGARVVATLYRAAEAGWFPFTAKFVSVKLDGTRAALNLVVVPTKVKNTATK